MSSTCLSGAFFPERGVYHPMRDINIKSAQYFEAVARLGMVSKAAKELGVSPSAVSQQVHQLETQLGVKLFRREKRRLVVTLDGDRLFQTTTQAFAAIRNARNAITRQREVRNLTIRVAPSFGVRWLGPRIASFLAENPDCNIRIDATPEFTAFDTEEVDFDLRYGSGGWPGLTVTCIMHDLLVPLCSPEYREYLRGMSPDLAEQLRAAQLLDSVKNPLRWDLWLASNRIDLPELVYPLRLDRSSMAIDLAKQGRGLALNSTTLCLPELKRGELVLLCPDLPAVEFPAYWFVCPPQHRNRHIVERFLAWILDACRSHDAEARALLTSTGCSIRPETGSGLISWAQDAHSLVDGERRDEGDE